MANRMDKFQGEKGSSARHLVLMFLAAVAVCAVFFSLGFVVGYNQSPTKTGPPTENVTSSSNIPPTVNPPSSGSSQPSTQATETENVGSGSSSIPQPERPQPLPPEAAAAPKSRAHTLREKAASGKVARSKPTAAPNVQSAAPLANRTASHFAVQVMASKTKVDAENLVKLLKSRGYPVYILTPLAAHARDNLYRVQVGPFDTRAAADITRDKLVGEGFRPFVVH